MKKIFCLVCFFSALFSLKSIADVPEGAIPFVFDGHLYLQSTLNDTIPVTLIYLSSTYKCNFLGADNKQ